LKGLTYGNGINETRSFDLAGRLSSITAPGQQSQTLGYDAADNITFITDALRPEQGGTFGYDALSRLTSQASAAGGRVFAYDPTGNRTRVEQTSAPASTVAFTIVSSSNRVGQRAGVAVTYDAAGNQTGDPETNANYSYDQSGRLRTASIGGVLKSTRTYNGLGQRAIKDTTPHDSRVVRAVYDEAGHVLSEAVLQGGTLLHYREYVWLEDRPLAQFTNVKAGSTWMSSVIEYLHTNQLERPLFMTDGAGTEVYRWRPADAFGVGTHETDVDGDGLPRDLRLGLPGQQWDGETLTWYNYFRDYNGRWGRYTQSDPIGLAGGVNSYAYADSRPLTAIDPSGLASYSCKKPLDFFGRDQGGHRSGAENPLNPFYHQYLCVVISGVEFCGGQTRSGGPYSAGADSGGSMGEGYCEMVEPDNECVEKCELKKLKAPRPYYGLLGPGTNCQEWVGDTIEDCKLQCAKKSRN
jgi:RHS repeat-associated protein